MALTLDEIKACLQAGNLQITNETALANGTGTQLRLQNGAIVNSYHTGNFNVQGKNQEAVKVCLGVQPAQLHRMALLLSQCSARYSWFMGTIMPPELSLKRCCAAGGLSR